MIKNLKNLFSAPITLTPREAVLGSFACGCAAAACLMTGMVVGMLISPKKEICIGSHNGGNIMDRRTITDTQEDNECVQF